MQVLPKAYSNFFLFCTLTGLRASECVEAVRLINSQNNLTNEPRAETVRGLTSTKYYNPELQVLQHYRFPDIFIRRTKAVYISIVDKEILGVAQSINKTPTLNALKMQSRHRSLNMKVKYCRKIYASWLHRCGISSDLVDMLQGRIGKNIFLKHYLTPAADYKDSVLDALKQLQYTHCINCHCITKLNS